MANNLADQLGRLTPDQLATITFESGFNANLNFSPSSYAQFVADSANAANPGDTPVAPEVDTIQNALQTGGTITIAFYNQVPADAFSQAEMDNALQSLAIWSGIADINFRVVPSDQASFIFVHSGDTIGADTNAIPAGTFFSARTTVPTPTPYLSRTTEGFIALDRTTTNSDGSLSFGDFTSLTNEAGYGFDVLVHEVGHLLGLGHTGPYNFNLDPALNVPSAPNQNNPTDVRDWSIMSYIDPNAVNPSDTTKPPQVGIYAAQYDPMVEWGTDPDSGFLRTPLTPMGLDFIAAQRLLGASTNGTFAGHKIFGFNSNITYTDSNGATAPIAAYDFALDPTPIVTLYDYGLDNTLDLSGFSDASTVDLRDGDFSSVAGLTDNIFIEWGTHIDTAMGGGANDIFTLNIDGDTIDGNGGFNTAVLPDRRADYAYDMSGGQVVLTDTAPGHAGANKLTDITSFVFSDATLAANALSLISWTGAVSHDFGIAGNWDLNQIPAGGDDVVIDGTAGTSVQVVQQQTNSFDSLFLNTGNTLDITEGHFGFSGATRASAIDGVLQLDDGASIYFDGNLVNYGTMEVAGDFLVNGPTVAISGSGKIALSNGDIASLQDASGSPLQYDAFENLGNTIDGFGAIGSSGDTFPIRFFNEGLVLADAPLPLQVKGAITNTGTLANSGLGSLDITGAVDNAGGTILAQGTDGGVLFDSLAVVRGGLLTATGGGVFEADGSLTLDASANPLTLDADLTLESGTALTVIGELTGSGTIHAAGARLFTSTLRGVGVPVDGNPTISLVGNGPWYYGSSIDPVLDPEPSVAPDHSVGFVTTDDGSSFVNSGTLTLAGTAGHGALMIVESNIQFSAVTFIGDGTIRLGSVDDTIVGEEEFGTPDSLYNENNTITGVGNIGYGRLNVNNGGVIRGDGGTLVLQPAAGDMIYNTGLLDAAAGGTLLVEAGVSNYGTIGGAGLVVLDGSVDNHGSAGLAGGTVQVLGTLNSAVSHLGFNGVLVLGGSIDGVSGAGIVQFETIEPGATLLASAQGGTLDGVINDGLMGVGAGDTVSVTGSLVNDGTIALNGSFDAGATLDHPAVLLVQGDVSLTGGGTITMGDRGDTLGGSGTLENEGNHITGQGTLGGGLTFLNDVGAVITGNGAGLVVDAGAGLGENFGTIMAGGGGTVELRGTLINGGDVVFDPVFSLGGTGAVVATGTGSLLRLGDVTLRNGIIIGTDGGAVHVTGAATLSSDANFVAGSNSADVAVENDTLISVDAGKTLTLINGLGNVGTLALADGAALVGAGGSGELAGGGTITLSDARIVGATGGDALANQDNLIIGSGTLGGGAAAFSNDGGRVVASGGTLLVDLGGGDFMNDRGGTLSAQNGLLDIAGGLVNNAYIDVGNGSIAVHGAVTGGGYITIDAGGWLGLDGMVVGSEYITFAGTNATLDIGAPAQMQASLDGLDTGDVLRFEGIAGDSVEFTGSSLVVESGGSEVASVTMYGDYFDSVFQVVASGGHTDVSLACYAEGTLIETAEGAVPVERLRVGQRVVSHFGGMAELRWLGHRSVECARHPRPWDVCPVRVAAHAFGPGLPARDLLLSPDHAVYVDGVLIPVRHLLNGATVRQEMVAQVTYWHVELPAHDVILAEGLPAESYLDTGNRAAFENGGPALHLHPDFALRVWDAEACAPLVRDGAALQAVRSQLLACAEVLGHAMTGDADVRVMVGQQEIRPEIDGRSLRFRIPALAQAARLVSRAAIPAQVKDDSTDHRRLGIAVARIAIDGRPIALHDPRLGHGWHTPEAAWRWTDGDATLALTGVLDIEIALTERYWAPRPPSPLRLSGG